MRGIHKIGFAIVAVLAILSMAAVADIEILSGKKGYIGTVASHFISGVPWHEQMNGLFCGPAAIETVYDFWGPDIDQKPIANVARSSSSGTWSYDIVRSGHFSLLSAAQGRFFPSAIPTAGYPERPLGYASFSHRSDEFWLQDLKSLIAMDIPVLVQMTMDPDGGGGHYRVVIGYNDSASKIYLIDPWGRDTNHETNWTGIIAWTYEEFESGWNYTEEGSTGPFHGVLMIPWKVDVSTKGKLTQGSNITISAKVTYPCPPPFNASEYPATECTASIDLPDGLSLADGPNSSTVIIGDMAAGSSVSTGWRVHVDGNLSGEPVTVTAQGNISGSLPEAIWITDNKAYPPYIYTDAIGGEGTLYL